MGGLFLLVFWWSVQGLVGGESQNGWLSFSVGYSVRAQCICSQEKAEAVPAYLEPNRNTMLKPKGGGHYWSFQ